jgi:two-component system LytT family response regulator
VQKAEKRIYEKRSLQQINFVNTQKASGKIAIPVNDGLQFISISHIIRLAAKGSYTQIFCEQNNTILSSRPLKDYEDILPPEIFFRAHHSHIINLSFVKHYVRGNGGYVTMIDGSAIDIAKRKKKEFLELFQG